MANDYEGGIVRLLYPDAQGAYVRLSVPVTQPNNYLVLRLEHPNYASIFSLLMASGANKLPINIRLDDADPDGNLPTGGIVYVTFPFPA